MVDRKVKVYCAIASYDKPEWGFVLTKEAMFRRAAGNNIGITLRLICGEALICRARNELLANFLKDNTHDYLLSLDDDLEMPEGAIVKLVEADKDIIGGFYRVKDKKKSHTAVRTYKDGPEQAEILQKEMVVPAIYVSTGIMLVKKSVIEKMVQHYHKDLFYQKNVTAEPRWALYQPYIHEYEYLSEDWAFCQRAKNIGFEVWAHGGVRCQHWGKLRYDFGEPE